ncbi:conserved hypothetical protein (plasmid) [Borreliella bissettiae DN127]|uniref:Uncharacterized protein n=1 Tax=Borrelia bissettiae (strain DSM 17990 / CIP 109136 / DN127) TaxID=521010 RepID=G0ANC8_BORBD|nr:DUF643 domain-containing protein [Borreliella bissettiae]AEL19204.1 conserved hypothetical protein [Borreliella bissettiae DN127]
MYINEISDFYDCLSPGTKKEISKLYGVKQLTLEQKKDFYRGFVSIQEYKRKTGKSFDEIINAIVDPAKNFIEDVLKDKHIIEKYKNFQNMKFDCRYKKGMLEKCLEKMGEKYSDRFLSIVSDIMDEIGKKDPKRESISVVLDFVEILFIIMHYYDKGICTRKYLIKTMKDFSEFV